MTVRQPPDRAYLGTPATAPGPAGPEMLRNTLRIRRDPLAFLADMRDRYGDVVQFPIPRPPTYLVSSTGGAEQMLVRNARNYGKDTIQYRSLSLVTGDGLLTADDPAWRAQRPVVQPAFHHSALAAVDLIAQEETDRLSTEWTRPGREITVDVESAMSELTLRVVARALFGDDLRGDTADLASATLDALAVVIQRSRVPVAVPRWLPTPANRRLDRSTRRLDDAVRKVIAHRLREPGAGNPALLVDLLLAADLTEQQVRDQIVTFLVAGHETAASGLTWALELLAHDSGWQDRIAGDDATANLVVDETLRLYPPAWVISRQARSDDEIEGYRIPAAALVFTSPYLLHRDQRYWDDPGEFRPQRFAGDGRRAGFLPFGMGPRLCIGRDFARREMAIALSGLCSQLLLSPADAATPAALPQVTLRPAGGLRLWVRPR